MADKRSDKKRVKAYLDSDVVEVDGAQGLRDSKSARKKALEKLRNSTMDSVMRKLTNDSIQAAKDGDTKKEERALKKLERLRKIRKFEDDNTAF